MRLRRLRADGFLSYDGLDLAINDRITFVVGPNGHGKSNIGHALRCVRAAVAVADRDSSSMHDTLAVYLGARRRDTAHGGIRLALDIELTGAPELRLMTAFVRAVVTHQLIGNTGGYDTTPINDWVEQTISDDELAALHRLTVIVDHAGHTDSPWRVSVQFTHALTPDEPVSYRWMLRGWTGSDEIMRAADADRLRQASTRESAADRLRGGVRREGVPPEPPADPFTLDRMLPGPGGAVQCALDLGASVTPPTRAFTDALGIDVRGEGDHNRHYTLAGVLRVVLDGALGQNADDRLSMPGTNRELGLDPWSMATTDRLARQLFELKNGPSAARTPLDRITRRFAALSNGRQIDVSIGQASSGLSTRQDQAGNETGSQQDHQLLVSVEPVAEGDRGEIAQVPIEFAGAGASEALLLASALEASADSTIFLDEPAATLHPTAQRRLATFLAESPAQFVVTTHSPYLVPYPSAEQIELYRFQLDDTTRTRAWRVDPGRLVRIAPKIVAKGNQGLPFAARLVLCEGQSDVVFVTALARRLGLPVEEANVLIVDCGSRDNLPDYIAFASELGLQLLAVMDGDASKAAKDPSVARAAQAVRDAVAASRLAKLVEYPENMEVTLGVAKTRNLDLAAVATTVDLTSDPVLRGAQQQLRRLIGGGQPTRSATKSTAADTTMARKTTPNNAATGKGATIAASRPRRHRPGSPGPRRPHND